MKDYLTRFLKELKKLALHINWAAAIVLSFTNSWGQDQYDLKTLLELSHQNNIQNIEKDILRVNYSIKRNISPTIDLGISEKLILGKTFDQISGEFNPKGNWYNTSNFYLKFQQELSSFLKLRINQKVYNAELECQKINQLINQKNIDVEIIDTYYTCLRYKQIIELNTFFKDKLFLLYQEYRELYNHKRIDLFSLLNEEKKIVLAEENILSNLSLYIKSKNKLKRLTGLCCSKNDFILKPNVPLNRDCFIENKKLLLEIKLFQAKAKLNSLIWKNSKSEILPRVLIQVTLGSYYSSIYNNQYNFINQIDFNNFFNINLSIDLPIYNKKKKLKMKYHKLNLELSNFKYELEKQQFEELKSNLMFEYQNKRKILKKLTKLKKISYRKFCLNQEKYNNREITITQLIESYIDFKEASMKFINSKFDFLKQQDILHIVFED